MDMILVDELDPAKSYRLAFDGEDWLASELDVDHRNATGEYVVRFGRVVAVGTLVEVAARLHLPSTVVTVVERNDDRS